MKTALDNLRVVLVRTRNPLNIGAVARAMSNFGAAHLRLVEPYEASFREARSAVGAGQLLADAVAYNTVAAAVEDCRLVVGTTAGGRRDLQHELRPLQEGARTIRRRIEAGPVALLFGSERTGLSNEEMSHCHWLMRIPTLTGHGSMNLGQAAAVCLHELIRTAKVAAVGAVRTATTNATGGNIERLTNLLYEVLDASGYVRPRIAAPTREKLRRLVRRMNLTEADAKLWLGILRQIDWAMQTRADDKPTRR